MCEQKRRLARALGGLKEETNQRSKPVPYGSQTRGHNAGVPTTARAQWVCFGEFVTTTGVFKRWVCQCALQYRSGNALNKQPCYMLHTFAGGKAASGAAPAGSIGQSSLAAGLHQVAKVNSKVKCNTLVFNGSG
jgi:hypothetical protein